MTRRIQAAMPSFGMRFERFRWKEIAASKALTEPKTVAVLFAGWYSILLSLLYIPRLPIHAKVTVRYLVPIIPMQLVLISITPSLQRTVREVIIWTAVGMVMLGSQLVVAFLVIFNLTRGEAMQLWGFGAALIGILTGINLAIREIWPERFAIVSSVLVGIAVGVGAMFVLLSGVVFFPYGDYAFGVVRVISETVNAVW